MKKTKISIEYPLRNTSINALWNSISTPFGMCEWFADKIILQGNIYTFYWNGSQQTATAINSKPLEHIQFQWEDDKDSEYYFEFRIVQQELTGEVMLVITDFVEANETEDSIMHWNKEIDTLKRRLGV